MAAGDTPITIVGNLVNDPELRFTASGQPVATFRVASTPRLRDNATGEWKDGDSLFLTCNVWRQMAENCAESLQRGMRVIVSGRLRQRNYETQQGEKRTVYEIEADDVGPSLLRASAKVTKATRAGGDGGFGGAPSGGGNPGGGSPAGSSASGGGAGGGSYGGGQRGGNGNSGGGARNVDPDPWASDNGGYSDEPPF
jgi:single-strand DNA-binding protein